MIEIEKEKKRKEAEAKEKENEQQQQQQWQQLHRFDELLDEQEDDRQSAVCQTMIQNVVDECKEKGFELPPSVLRLLTYFKGKKKTFISYLL